MPAPLDSRSCGTGVALKRMAQALDIVKEAPYNNVITILPYLRFCHDATLSDRSCRDRVCHI